MKISKKLVLKTGAVALGLGMLGGAILPLAAVAKNGPGYLIGGTASTNGLSVSISGTASADPFTGQYDDQYVSVDWTNDGTPDEQLLDSNEFIYTSTNPNGTIASTTFSASHTYGAPGAYTIVVKIYHANWNGNEAELAALTFNVNLSYQCSDQVDNDQDGLTDYPADPGCTSPTDDNETNAPIPTFTITSSNGSNSTIFPLGATVVNQGANQAFTFSASLGYLLQVLVDGVSNPATSTYTFTNVTANHTIDVSASLIPPTEGSVTVNKVVVGGPAVEGDFTLKVGEEIVLDGIPENFTAGTYVVSESPAMEDYVATYEGACDPQTHEINVVAGESHVCTITNTYTPTDADLAVMKSVDDLTPAEGQDITYTITVTNNGPADATGVVVSDNLPTGVTYKSDNPSTGTYDDTTGTWTVGGLANGASETLTITVTVDEDTGASTITNFAVTDGEQTDPDTDNNTSDTVDVQVECPSGTHDNNDGACVANSGTLIVKKVIVGSEAGYEEFSFSVNDGEPTGFDTEDGQNELTLDPGSYSVTEAEVDHYETTYSNDANEDSTCTELSLESDATVTCTITNTYVPYASISITKSVDDEDQVVDEGQEITYTITVHNDGPDSATGVVVTDVLPTGVTYVSDNSGGAYNSTTGEWTVGSLANGADASLSITVTIKSETGADTISNTASVTSENGGDDTTEPTDVSVACPDGTHEDEGSCVQNPPTTGTLTIVKNTTDGNGTFNFAVAPLEGTAEQVSVVTEGGVGTDDTVLEPGSYSLTETVPDNWTLESISCEYDNQDGVQEFDNGDSFSIKAGDHITCTFANKYVAPAEEPASPPSTPRTRSVPAVINRGQVLGASTGQVLGESCGLYMDQHLRRGSAKNNSGQVTKLQAFLNKHMGSGLPSTGYFGPLTEAAVKAFQNKYSNEILKPWGIGAPTGLAYLTTLRQVNLIECPELMIEVPTLVEWSRNPSAQ